MVSVGQSFQQLRNLDIDGNNKVSQKEIQFLKKLGEIGEDGKATIGELKDLLKNLSGDEKKQAVNIINSALDNKVMFDESGSVMYPSNLPNNSSVDINLNKNMSITKTDGSEIKKLDLKMATTLAKDVDNGDDKISDFDDVVAKTFLGKTASSHFDPTKKEFDFNPTKKVTSDGGTSNIKMDIEEIGNNYKSASEISKLKDELKQFKAGDKSFGDFAKEKGIDINNIKGEDIGKISEFVKDLSSEKQKEFISKFLDANFVHCGEGITDQGTTKANYTKALDKLPADPLTGRKEIDCTFYSAISQELLSKTPDVKTQPVFVRYGNDVPHDILVSRNDKTKEYTVFSNNKSFNVSADDLKAVNASTPPTDEDITKAALPKIKSGQMNNQNIIIDGLRKTSDPFGQQYDRSVTTLKPGDTFKYRGTNPNDPNDGKTVTVLPPDQNTPADKVKIKVGNTTTLAPKNFANDGMLVGSYKSTT